MRQHSAGQTAEIYVRNRLLITVDRNLAKANDTSIEGLAAHWARNLRWALPQVNVTIRMSRDFPLIGARSAPPTVTEPPASLSVPKGAAP